MLRKFFYLCTISLLIMSVIMPNLATAAETTNGKSKVTTSKQAAGKKATQNTSNGFTTKEGVPNAPKPETNLTANSSDSSQVNVSTWDALQSAVVNKNIKTIFIQADIYNTKNSRAVSVTTRSLTVHGNGHYVDFRDTSFEMNTKIAKDSNFLLRLNNITMYGYNYYGPFSVWSAPTSGSKMVLSYNDVTYVGTQLTASWDWDIEFMGTVENHSVNSYISPYNGTTQTGNQNQANIEATNLVIRDNTYYNGSTQNAGVLYLGNSGTMTIGDDADVILNAGRDESFDHPGEFESYALYLEGRLVTGKNAELTINTRPTGNQHAIYINGKNNGFTANKGAVIKLNSTGPSGPKQLLYMKSNTLLKIEDDAELHLIAKNKGSNGNSLLTVEDNSEFIIGQKGVLNAVSDGTGTQTILYFGPGSIFRFADAKQVNVQYVNPDVSPDSVLFKMGGSTGKLDVDVHTSLERNRCRDEFHTST